MRLQRRGSRYRKVNTVKIYKAITLTIIMILIAALFAGCATFDNFKATFIDKNDDTKAVVRIGIYEPTSGADKANGELEIEGIELAHEMYPTVNGKFVELVYADNASDIHAAETAIKELILKNPSVILGSYGSVYSMVAGDYVKDAKIPAIAITNTNPLVTSNNGYYFRVCYVDSNQGDLLARYVLEEKKETTAGVLLPAEDDVAMAMATAFTSRIKAETDNEDAITVYEEYKHGATDFTKQLKAVKKAGVKSVLLPGDVTDAANIIKQADSMGLDVVFLGDKEWADNEFRKLTNGKATEANTAFVNFYAAEETTNKEAEKFLKAYHKKYGNESVPEDSVALGYDAYIIALKAIDDADDNATSKEIRDVLKTQSGFQGASGTITFNATGDPIKTAYISTWKNGSKIETLYTLDPLG